MLELWGASRLRPMVFPVRWSSWCSDLSRPDFAGWGSRGCKGHPCCGPAGGLAAWTHRASPPQGSSGVQNTQPAHLEHTIRSMQLESVRLARLLGMRGIIENECVFGERKRFGLLGAILQSYGAARTVLLRTYPVLTKCSTMVWK